jgi:hypothetical protein
MAVLSLPVLTAGADDWLHLGLEVAGFNAKRQNCAHRTNLRRFESYYGGSPPEEVMDHVVPGR